MIAELNGVALKVGRPERELAAGDVGAGVHACYGGDPYAIEFVTFDGRTGAGAKPSATQMRPLTTADIHHTRPLERATK